VRDRLAKEELLIELELGLSKKILVQTSRSRTLESTNKSNTKSKKAKDRKIECKLVGIEAKSAILNPESWQINGFEASHFLKLWIVVAEIHESYWDFVNFLGSFVKPLKLKTKNQTKEIEEDGPWRLKDDEGKEKMRDL
jgi:hypothetical protein